MVAAQNTVHEAINWDALDHLAQRHLDMSLDDLLERVKLSRGRLENAAHEDALKTLGRAIAQWRLKVRVYRSETHIARNKAPYLRLDYGFGTIAVFASTVNSIFRNTAHLVVDWRQEGYVYEFHPYIIVTTYLTRDGYPAISKLEDAPMPQKRVDVPENLKLHINSRYPGVSMVDRAKYMRAYTETLQHAYEQAEKQDESSGWWRRPRQGGGSLLPAFPQIEYVYLDGLLERREVTIPGSREFEYRITEKGCTLLGRAYPVQKDQLGQLLTLDDENIDDDAEVEQILAMETRLEREQAAAAGEAEPIDDLDKIVVGSWVTLPGSTQPGEIWVVTDVDPDKKTNDPKRTLLSLQNYSGNKITPAILITQVKLFENDYLDAQVDELAPQPDTAGDEDDRDEATEIETEEAAPAAELPEDDTPASGDETEDEPVDEELDELVEWAKFINGQAPRIEVKTLIQPLNGTTAAADKALAEHLNDCWEIINLTVTTINDDSGDWSVPYTTRIVTLQRTSSQPSGKSRASAYVPARNPRQMVTPVGEPLVIRVPTAPDTTLNQVIDRLPVASAMRRDGAATVREQMNAAALEAGQNAYDKSMQSYPRRSFTAIPAKV